MAESEAFFGMAADKDPRAASAFGRAMGKAQGTQMALEADAQKTALANAEAERLLRLKAALTPRTGAGAYRKAIEPKEAALKASEAVKESYRKGELDLPEGMTIDQYAAMAAQEAYNMIVSGPSGGGSGSCGWRWWGWQ